jgi:hypothetical protein
MKFTATLGACTLTLLATWLPQSPAAATDTLPTGLPQVSMSLFNQLDRNADGMLSFIEARQDKALGLEFYRMDLDLDGYLSPRELGTVRA